MHDLGSAIVVAGAEGTDTLCGDRASAVRRRHDHAVDDGNTLFDTLYYLSRNPDVFHAGVNALDHFNTFGWHEGRNPNAILRHPGYLAANPDVAAAGVNPLEHYHQTGWHEGRDPSASFDTTLYLVAQSGRGGGRRRSARALSAVRHRRGPRGLRGDRADIVDGFDAAILSVRTIRTWRRPASIRCSTSTPFGWHEGRNPNAWFDTAGYLAHYADVAAAGVNPLEHYELFGWKEGRDPSAGFDTLGYLAANPDVAAANVNPLDHFLQFGIYEGRQAVNDGVWH